MKLLNKKPEKDFIILNLSDPQLGDGDYYDGKKGGEILRRTLNELVEKEKPDLITVSGDIAWAEHYTSYKEFAELMQKTGIPWAPVWGNHDNQGGEEAVEIQGMILKAGSNLCLYEKGYPASDGQGNYTIGITENGRPVTAVMMVDSHDRADYKGELEWAKLYPDQIRHIEGQCHMLRAFGYQDALMVLHIPIYAYRTAFEAAFSGICEPKDVKPEESADPRFWNEGYQDSFGVLHEGICSYPEDEGAFEAIKRGGLIRTIVAGHDHTNDFCICYQGIRLVYSLKAGCGCYWQKELNGGTVIRIGSDGVREVRQSYVDVSDLI